MAYEKQNALQLFRKFQKMSPRQREFFLDELENQGLAQQKMAQHEPNSEVHKLVKNVDLGNAKSEPSGPRSGWPVPYIEMDSPEDEERMAEWGFSGAKMPVPWINTSAVRSPHRKDWLSFDEEALKALEAADFELCAICGEQLGEDKVYGVLGKGKLPSDHPNRQELYRTTGSGMHPKCSLLSLKYCPHLQQLEEEEGAHAFVAIHGKGNGLESSSLEKAGGDVSEVLLDGRAKPLEIHHLKNLAKAKARSH